MVTDTDVVLALSNSGETREILAIVSLGCSQATAAEYVGCSVSTIQRTVERDPLGSSLS